VQVRGAEARVSPILREDRMRKLLSQILLLAVTAAGCSTSSLSGSGGKSATDTGKKATVESTASTTTTPEGSPHGTPVEVSVPLNGATNSSIAVGDKLQPKIGGAPTTGNYTWVSKDPAVATVDPTTGVITGVAPGSTDVVAQDKSGSPVATIHVTIKAPDGITADAATIPAVAPTLAEDGFVAPGTTYTVPKCAKFTGVRTVEGVVVDALHQNKVATCADNERVLTGYCQCHQGATWVRGNSGANGWACSCNQNPELVASYAVCLQCVN
jgi:hypothetical protein